MPVGQPLAPTPRYGCTILTSDPTTGIVEAQLKGGDMRRVLIFETPVAFRWPVAGESWVVRQENGTWYLDSPIRSATQAAPISTANPGDVVLNSPTGVVRVTGSASGATDFTLSASGFTPQPTWHNLAYATNWSDYGSSFQTGQYCIDLLGFVHIRGLVKKSTAMVSGDLITTLPVGFRPASAEIFTGMAWDTVNGIGIYRSDVYPDGTVRFNANSVPSFTTPGPVGWATIAGITYKQAG